MEEENENKKKSSFIALAIKYKVISLIILLSIGLFLFGTLYNYLTKIRGIEDPDDKKNGPSAARNLINNTNIGQSGNIELGETIQETWDRLQIEGNDLTNYLDSAQELAKLITAASALDYPDTRENPDAPIDWNDIDVNSKDIQGIVKFKRALADGNTITMRYVSPSKFNQLVNNYLSSGSASDRDEALKYFTVERTAAPNSSGLGDSTVQELLRYACSWVGKVPYKSVVSGHADNNERFQRLQEGVASDCSHFVHWCFEHIGLMDEDGFVHSLDWGNGGDNGGCPGTVRIGTDLSQASPGDVLWWHFGGGPNNHVAIYLGRGKMVECAADHGVIISDVSGGFDQILHFTSLPTDPTGYFDIETNTLYGTSGANGGSGQAIIDEAQKYVGKLPYVWGGQSLSSGADCSGFVWAILTKLGLYSGPRTNDAGFRNKGTEVTDLAYAQAGDVICYDGHIGFYDGHGGLIHESNHRDGCKHSDSCTFKTILTIRRFVSDNSSNNTTSNKSTSKSNSKSTSKTSSVPVPNDDFSVETRQIIDAHKNDFNCHNYKEFISSYPGGYEGYLKSLGGVFEKYAGKGKSIQVKNAGEFQEVAEYTWGLFTIWGFDYYNESFRAYWGDDDPEVRPSAYYPEYQTGGYSNGHIDDICSNPNRGMRTNCNTGANSFLIKAGLTDDVSFLDHDKRGEQIDRAEDLLIGDLVQFYDSTGGWHHVAVVGEIDPELGPILYDSGNRFIRYGKYKIPLNSDKYSDYDYWVGRRRFNLDQSTTRTSAQKIENTIYKVKVATWQDCKETVVSKGNSGQKKDQYVKEGSEYTYSMNVRTIPFQDIVAQYKMPFNYLWDMLLISNDKRFVFDLADSVRNSKIEITVHDNLKETTTKKTEKYVRNYEYKGTMSGTATTQVTSQSNKPQTYTGSASAEDTELIPYVFEKIRTIYDRTNNLDIALTLADAWCVRYQKNYIYSGKTNTIGYPSTVSLDDVKEDPIPGKKITNSELRNRLIDTIKGKISKNILNNNLIPLGNLNLNVTSESQVLNISATDRKLTTTVSTVEYKYIAAPENATDNNFNGSSGYLYNSNYTMIDTSKVNRGGIQQGFCLAGDYYAYVTEVNEVSSLFLVDMKTNKQLDVITGIGGHGNTIAYDSRENQIIYIQDETEKMLIYKIENGKLRYLRTRRLPKHDAGGVYVRSDLAYNEQNDKFIFGIYVYTREAFYNRGNPSVKTSYKKPANTELQGSCTHGNHVFYNYSTKDYKSGNYLIACNINTGREEEEIYDDMPRELEEGSFDKEGNLYLMYGGTKLYKTAYNYFSDSNLDTSNVSNTYNLGGGYFENNKFVDILKKYPSAKSNIISSKDTLFEIMENNADTANMIDLTKYFLYKATGINYGVTDFMTAFGKLTQGFNEMSQLGGTSGIDGIPGQIYDFLLAKGVPPVGAAAIVGNIQGESSFKPDVVNYLGCSGLCQWYKGRLDNLKSLAASKGTDWTDVNTQMEYLWSELDNKYTGVRDVIMSADQESELEYATWYWGRYFEVFFLGDSFEATKGKTAKRYEYAQYWYEQWQQHHTEGTASSIAFAHGSAEEKVRGLFPNGIPTTREQAESYLVTINVPITNKNGTKGNRGVRVHRAISQDVYNACQAAQNAGFKIYDIGGYRTFGTDTAGRSGGLSYSQHCYGLAVDINPTENGQFKNGRATGNWFYDPGNNEYSIQSNSTLVTTFKSLGWGWGGEWNSSKDYMHFSFMGT